MAWYERHGLIPEHVDPSFFAASNPQCPYNLMCTKITLPLYPQRHFTADYHTHGTHCGFVFLLSRFIPPIFPRLSFILILIARSTICYSFVYSGFRVLCTALLVFIISLLFFFFTYNSCSVTHRRYRWTSVSLTYLCNWNERLGKSIINIFYFCELMAAASASPRGFHKNPSVQPMAS